jgi:hypothetical protein
VEERLRHGRDARGERAIRLRDDNSGNAAHVAIVRPAARGVKASCGKGNISEKLCAQPPGRGR